MVYTKYKRSKEVVSITRKMMYTDEVGIGR